VLVEMGELLIQEQQVLEAEAATAAAAAVAPTMAVQTGLEETPEVIQEPTDQKTQVALLEEMEAKEVRLAVETAEPVEM
jgi:hypothetical protein